MSKGFSNHCTQNTPQGPIPPDPPSSQWTAILGQPPPGDSFLTPDPCLTPSLPIHQLALWTLPSKQIQDPPLCRGDAAPHPVRAPHPHSLDKRSSTSLPAPAVPSSLSKQQWKAS